MNVGIGSCRNSEALRLQLLRINAVLNLLAYSRFIRRLVLDNAQVFKIGIDALPSIPVKTLLVYGGPTEQSREPMRFYLLTILCALALGCNSDPNCRRETALLRSEILDLEDKYYLLKSERDALLQSQGAAVNEIYAASDAIYEQPAIIQGQLLQGDVIYDQGIPYSDGQSFDSQSYYVDTGEPYYGEPTYADAQTFTNGHYADPDIIYDNEIVHPSVSGYQDLGEYQDPGIYPNQIVESGIVESGIVESGVPTLAQLPGQLAPDDSIVPLYSSQHDTTELQPEDFDLSAPQLDEELDSYQLELSDEHANKPSDAQELDLLLESPEDLEVGFNQGNQLQEITEVVINRLATRGHDIDGVPGDEGLDLLIQPRSADGQVQLATGQLTVSVIDPSQPAARQRIGLWKFIESETELFFANNELGSYGILLHLPWDQQTPVNENLTIHVRFVPPNGQTFETTSQIRINPPQSNYSPDDPMVTGWTRSDHRWDAGAGSTATQNRSNLTTSQWIRLKTSPRRRQVAPIERSRIQALPAKAQIRKPAWRPTR